LGFLAEEMPAQTFSSIGRRALSITARTCGKVAKLLFYQKRPAGILWPPELHDAGSDIPLRVPVCGVFKEEPAMLSRILSPVLNFLRREEGPTAIEYGVLLAVIVVFCMAAISLIGTQTDDNFNQLNTSLSASS
jgi:pilus assembly protein Flp/PilA